MKTIQRVLFIGLLLLALFLLCGPFLARGQSFSTGDYVLDKREASGFSRVKLSAGSGITLTPGTGTLTLTNTLAGSSATSANITAANAGKYITIDAGGLVSAQTLRAEDGVGLGDGSGNTATIVLTGTLGSNIQMGIDIDGLSSDITLLHSGSPLDPYLLVQQGATDGQALVWSASNSRWQPGTVSGGTAGEQGQEVNVKSATYGAVGDAIQLRDAVSTSGDNTVTSASASFVGGDVGKIVFAGDPSSHTAVVPWGTITAVNSSSSIEVSVAATASATGLYLVYGTADDTDAFQAAAAAVKAMSPPGTLRIPAGGYIIKGTPFDFGQASLTDAAPAVVGDGSESTILYVAPSFSATSDTLMYLNGNCARGKVSGLSVEGSYIQPLVSLGLCFNPGGGRVLFEDVKITRLHQIIGFQIIGQHCVLDRCYVEICTGYYGWGIYCNASGVSIRDTYAGNNGNWSLYCANGAEVIWERGTLDESGGTAPAVLVAGSSKLTISNCQYVYSVGGSVPAIQLQGTAQLRMINSWAGPYASRPNAYALDVDSGCKAYLMQSVLERNDTPNALIIDSGGTVYDGGNNEVESTTNNGTLTTLSITP